jgi:hypothetical protein
MPAHKDLGTLLAEEQLISTGDLERARRACREQGGRLLTQLLESGLVGEDAVFRLLAERAGIATRSDDELGSLVLAEEVLERVPRALAMELELLPLDLLPDGRTLSLAACDPTDEAALERVRRAANVEAVQAYAARRCSVLAAIDRVYSEATLPGREEGSPKVELDPDLAREIAAMEVQAEFASEPVTAPARPHRLPASGGTIELTVDDDDSAPTAVLRIEVGPRAAAPEHREPPAEPPPPEIIVDPPTGPAHRLGRADVQVPLDVVHRTASEAAALRVRTQPPRAASDRALPPQAAPLPPEEFTPTPLPEPFRPTPTPLPGPMLDLEGEPTQVRRSPARPRVPTPPPVTAPAVASPPPPPSPREPPAAGVDDEARTPIPEMLRAADEQHSQTLIQIIGQLVDLAERHLAGRAEGRELGRMARRLARELGLTERAVAEIGVAAELFGLDRSLRAATVDPPDLLATLGDGSADEGLPRLLRALFDEAAAAAGPPGAQVVLAAADLVVLASEAGAVGVADAQVARERLAARGAPSEVVDAVLRVIAQDRVAKGRRAGAPGGAGEGERSGGGRPRQKEG